MTPNPGNTVQVQLLANTSLGAIGFTSLGGGATISAVYNRFPAISATAATFSAGTAPIAFIQPFYAIVLGVSNGTITATLPSASTAQTANTTTGDHRELLPLDDPALPGHHGRLGLHLWQQAVHQPGDDGDEPAGGRPDHVLLRARD